MVSVRGRRGAWFAALGLALLTLSVFYVLQDYGPESAIRRFHDALIRGDEEALQEVTAQPLQSRRVVAVVRFTQEFFLPGTVGYRVGRMDRRGNEVRAAVVYFKSNGRQDAMIWIVTKDGPQWKVDADRTATILFDALQSG